MGSSRHRDRSRDRDRDRDRGREKDRDRDRERRERKRSRDRDRDRHRDRDRERERERRDRDRERRSRSRSKGRDKSKEKTPEPDGDKLLAETLATIAATRQYASLTTPKLHDENSNDGGSDDNSSKKKKRSRWGGSEHDKIFIPGMPTILPMNLNKDQEQAYLLQLQIEEVSRKLRSGDLGIPANPEERGHSYTRAGIVNVRGLLNAAELSAQAACDGTCVPIFPISRSQYKLKANNFGNFGTVVMGHRSPSPEPIYSSDGKRLNTREFRTRRRLEEERHALVLRMQSINPDFKPPVDYKPPVIRVSDKVMIPQEEHPEINFVGLLIGPRGNTLKTMEKETGAKIIIRGKGSVKEGKVGRKDGQPLPGEDEPLHAYITATNPECVKKAVERIKEVIRQGVEVPENQNDLRRMQLRELAQLNGTLRENDGLRCNNCGATDHKSWLCPDKPNVTNNIVCSSCGAAGHIARDCRQKRPGLGGPAAVGDKAKIDEEYMSLMAELGEGPPPEFLKNGVTMMTPANTITHRKNGINMFDPQTAPRPLMPPPMPAPPMMPNIPNGISNIPPPPWGATGTMPWQPGPPGIMPPPPPPGASSPPQMMPWMNANNQPPPPGATTTTAIPPPNIASMPPWQPPFQWPPSNCAPPPPPGIDMTSLLTAPPPPPPTST